MSKRRKRKRGCKRKRRRIGKKQDRMPFTITPIAFRERSVYVDNVNESPSLGQICIAGDFPARYTDDYTWDGNRTCSDIQAVLGHNTEFFIHDLFPFAPTCLIKDVPQHLISNFLSEAPPELNQFLDAWWDKICLLYTSPSPRDRTRSRMPSSA